MMFRRGYSIAVLSIVAASLASTVDAFNLRSELLQRCSFSREDPRFPCHSFVRYVDIRRRKQKRKECPLSTLSSLSLLQSQNTLSQNSMVERLTIVGEVTA